MAQQLFNPPSAQDLENEIREVVLDADTWLKTPHNLLGGREPSELVNGTPEDRMQVYNLIKAIEHGMIS